VPFAESDPVFAPISPYAASKLACEALGHVFHHVYGMDIVMLRFFTVYGPRQRPDMAFHRICSAALTQRPFVVFGDGQQTRDFSYVGDIVVATIAAATADLNGERIINVGGGSPASLSEVISLVEQLTGRRLEVQHVATEHGDVRDTSADITLARRLLGFAPSMTLASGLEREFDWLVGVHATL